MKYGKEELLDLLKTTLSEITALRMLPSSEETWAELNTLYGRYHETKGRLAAHGVNMRRFDSCSRREWAY